VRLPTSKLEALEGLISPATGRRLAQLAADVPADRAIVEVGAYKGKSTCYLAAGARAGAGAKVFTVDAWDLEGNIGGRFGFDQPSVREQFDAQVASVGLADRIVPIRAFSRDAAAAWDGPPIGMLFIDGHHLLDSVLEDFDVWAIHLADEATVVFDDYQTERNPGVQQAVDELAARGLIRNLDVSTPPLAVSVWRAGGGS
jgi:hypothetical protein